MVKRWREMTGENIFGNIRRVAMIHLSSSLRERDMIFLVRIVLLVGVFPKSLSLLIHQMMIKGLTTSAVKNAAMNFVFGKPTAQPYARQISMSMLTPA